MHLVSLIHTQDTSGMNYCEANVAREVPHVVAKCLTMLCGKGFTLTAGSTEETVRIEWAKLPFSSDVALYEWIKGSTSKKSLIIKESYNPQTGLAF